MLQKAQFVQPQTSQCMQNIIYRLLAQYVKNEKQTHNLNFSLNINNQLNITHLQLRVCNFVQILSTFKGSLGQVLGKGLIFSEGQHWKMKRKVFNPFFTFENISKLAVKQTNIFTSFAVRSEQSAKINEDGSLQYCVFQFATSVAEKMLFDCYFGGQIQQNKINNMSLSHYLSALAAQASGYAYDPAIIIFGEKFFELGLRKKDRQYKKKMKKFDDWVFNFFSIKIQAEKKKRLEQKQNYVMENLVAAMEFSHEYQNKSGTDYKFTLTDKIHQFRTFFITQTDVMPNYLQSLIYFIFKTPQVEQKFRQELFQNNITLESSLQQIKKLSYLQAIHIEVMRLLGPANNIITRQVIKDHNIQGAKIHKGCALGYYTIAAHYSADTFIQPLKFRPQRWINGQCDNLHPMAVFGFHGGQRGCIGKQFVLYQTKVSLVMLALRYKSIEIPSGEMVVKFNGVFGVQNFTMRVCKN